MRAVFHVVTRREGEGGCAIDGWPFVETHQPLVRAAATRRRRGKWACCSATATLHRTQLARLPALHDPSRGRVRNLHGEPSSLFLHLRIQLLFSSHPLQLQQVPSPALLAAVSRSAARAVLSISCYLSFCPRVCRLAVAVDRLCRQDSPYALYRTLPRAPISRLFFCLFARIRLRPSVPGSRPDLARLRGATNLNGRVLLAPIGNDQQGRRRVDHSSPAHPPCPPSVDRPPADRQPTAASSAKQAANGAIRRLLPSFRPTTCFILLLLLRRRRFASWAGCAPDLLQPDLRLQVFA